ncbi:MAG: glycosyltransferase family 4 protein [Melioribacteraceae bacterium]|nr:glycosyltransferase family 4 protein [Melioribacteraceae bacterium]
MKIGMLLDKEFYGDMRVENEARVLAENGFDIYVYCFSFDGIYREDDYYGAKIINIPVSRKYTRKLRALTNTILNFYPDYLFNLLKKYILRHEINVLHIHDLYLFEVGLKIKNSLKNLFLVGDLHENYVEGLKHYKFANSFPGNLIISIPKWEKAEIEWCNQFDRLITVIDEAVSRYTALGIDKNKISVVANYVNKKSFLSDDTNKEIVSRLNKKFSLLYIGGFDIHRGLESVIKAMPKICKKVEDAQLVLVGRGINEPDLKKLGKELGIENKILFEGFQPASLLPSYIIGSQICLIPHLKTVHTDNTIPHKLFHYMSLGKPVVASNCRPIKRIIEETNSGLIYESNNEDDLEEKIISLYEDHALRNVMGRNGISGVEKKYNWSETSKNLINLYKDIFSGKHW